uniref:Uncharacterized protein n=1 Tax=Panagrellus redivivus TaxID=6233 RepID=A0A7E4ZWA0_PANRE
MEIDPRLLSLSELAILAQTPRELVKVMMNSGMLRPAQNCSRCGKNMTLTTRGSAADGCIWRCRESRNQDCSMKSVRHGTSFERAKLSLADMLKFALLRTSPGDDISRFDVYREYILPDVAETIQNEPCVSTDMTVSLAMLSEQLGIVDPTKSPPRPASSSSKDTNDNVKNERDSPASLFSLFALSEDDSIALSFLVAAVADELENPSTSENVKDQIWAQIHRRISQRVTDSELTPEVLQQHYSMLRRRDEFNGKSARQIAEEMYSKIKGTNHTIRFEDVFDTNLKANYPQWLFDIIFKDPLLSKHVRQRRKRNMTACDNANKKRKTNGDVSSDTVVTNGFSPQPQPEPNTASTPLSFPFLAEESEFTSRQRREEELHQARIRRDEEIHQAQLRHDEELHQARLAMQDAERREVEARTQLTLLQVEIKRAELSALRG